MLGILGEAHRLDALGLPKVSPFFMACRTELPAYSDASPALSETAIASRPNWRFTFRLARPYRVSNSPTARTTQSGSTFLVRASRSVRRAGFRSRDDTEPLDNSRTSVRRL